ncbi:9265_t:CDS:1, partial [Dentiscutata erythropus]
RLLMITTTSTTKYFTTPITTTSTMNGKSNTKLQYDNTNDESNSPFQ